MTDTEGHMDSMEIVQVPIKDLEIDLPVSDANVAQKKASLEGVGMVQPVTVWFHDGRYRIIDGFHRVVAAGLLGWKTVPCVVRACDEGAFWDARLQSARQHAEVSDERCMAWMRECWRHSRWGAAADDLVPLIRRLWEIQRDCNNPRNVTLADLKGDARELVSWVGDKAIQWGVTFYDLRDTLFKTEAGLIPQYRPSRELDEVAAELRIPYEDRVALGHQYYQYSCGDDPEKNKEEIRQYYATGFRDGKDLRIWRREKDQVDRLRRVAAERADEERAEKARRAYEATPEGRTKREQTVRRLLMMRYDAVDEFVSENRATLLEMPDGPDLLAALAEWALQKIAEMWPGAEKPDAQVPAILAENVRLRAALAKEHGARVAAEARLGQMDEAQAKIAERLPDVMAWSSSLLEGLP